MGIRFERKSARILNTVSGLEIKMYLFVLIFRSYSVSEPILPQVPSSFVIDLGCAVSITHVRLRNSGSNHPNPARKGKICNEIKIMYM